MPLWQAKWASRLGMFIWNTIGTQDGHIDSSKMPASNALELADITLRITNLSFHFFRSSVSSQPADSISSYRHHALSC